MHFPALSKARNLRSLLWLTFCNRSLFVLLLQGARIHQKRGFSLLPFSHKSEQIWCATATFSFFFQVLMPRAARRGKVSTITSFPSKTKLTCNVLGFSKEQKKIHLLRLHFFLLEETRVSPMFVILLFNGAFRKGRRYPTIPRLRTICVDIAHSFIWRNIDAYLLREHSARRYCVKYKCLQKIANLTYASTQAAFLQKKILHVKKIAHAKKIFWLDSNLRPSGLIALIAQICAQLRYLALKKSPFCASYKGFPAVG